MQDEHGTSDEPGTGTSHLRSLRTTPMRDLARGRVTGRLDLQGLLASSTLPESLRKLVSGVVRRTRLRRIEKMDVARELVEHFEDGIAADASAEELVVDFGDPRIAATLIRRGMKRKRSWFERAVRRTVLVAGLFFAGFVAIYLVFAVRYWNQPVRIEVDYVAKIRQESDVAAPDDRGWPEIRAAIGELRAFADPASTQDDRGLSTMIEAASAGTVPAWIEMVAGPGAPPAVEDAPSDAAQAAFFANATTAIDALRGAASKSVLGFPMGVDGGGPEVDRAFLGLAPSEPTPVADRTILDGSVIDLQFPYYGTIRLAARVLSTDARRAAERGEGARFLADVDAMFGLGHQVRTPTIVIGQLVGMSIERLAFATILDVLAQEPGALDDPTLDRLAAIVTGLDDDRLRIRTDSERYYFLDLAQRFYTDDGDGNGRLKFISNDAARAGGLLDADDGRQARSGNAADFLLGPLVAGVTMDRRGATEIWNRNLDGIEAGNSIEPWEIDASKPPGLDGPVFGEADASWLSEIRLFPVSMLLSATHNVVSAAGAIRLERDLVRTVIELELHRRTHGSWPTSNDAVGFVGRDPFDGESLRYVLRDGVPMIYILGPDRIDDGGVWITGRNGIDRVARAGLAGTSKYWGRIPNDSGEGLLGDVPVWIGRAAVDATGGDS